MFTIADVLAREVLDSRGNPTVEVDVTLADGTMGSAIVPSGASTGIHEALELRDEDNARYLGKGVMTAVTHVNTEIAENIIDTEFSDYKELDTLMIDLDGTPNKARLGANAILGVSMAFVDACAAASGLPVFAYLGGEEKSLPMPMMNVINGGSHADNTLDIQEFMIVPVGGDTIKDRIRMGAEIFHHLKKILNKKGLNTAVGDEGGFAPNFATNSEALDTLLEAVESAGYTTEDVKFALDVAAAEFYEDGVYNLAGEGKKLSADEMVVYYQELVAKYPIISIEDGMDEDDFDGWKSLTKALGDKIMLVGDDLFVTNIERFQDGIDGGYANSILIKLNQIGTVSETLAAIQLAHDNDMEAIISHRSGETEDVFIADLAVGLSTGWIKTGSLSRTDRIAKYNQLIRIEEQLEASGEYNS